MKRKHQALICQHLHKINRASKNIARKKDASVIHENEQQSQKEARAHAEETRKRCLKTFSEISERTAETSNEEDTKKKKRARQSGCETINYTCARKLKTI